MGKVADTMSAFYAERHKVLPVQVNAQRGGGGHGRAFYHRLGGRGGAPGPPQRAHGGGQSAGDPPLHRRVFCAGQIGARRHEVGRRHQRRPALSSWWSWAKQPKQLDANDQGVVQVVDWLWQYAFDQRASDIHLEPRREQGVIRFRIDGVLHPVYQMPMGVLNAMTARIKLLGRMDVVEKRRPQDGRIKTRNPRGDEIEMRMSTLPTAFGEKMVMRIFDPDNAVKDLDATGL